MKKIVIMVLVLIAFAVACKANTKPKNKENIGVEPPVIKIGEDALSINDRLEAIGKSSTWDDWNKTEYLIKDKNTFNGGFLVGNFQGAYWTVLGITSESFCLYGEGSISDDKLQDALNMAGSLDNRDPRKLIYAFDGSNNVNITWSARTAKAGNKDFSVLVSNTDYDIDFKAALHGGSTYSIINDYEVVFYKNLSFNNEVKKIEEEFLKSYGWDKASFIIEKNAKEVSKGKKAWLYVFTEAQKFGLADVVRPNGVRFGYAPATSKAGEYYLSAGPSSGSAPKDSVLVSVSAVNAKQDATTMTNSRAPAGKTVFSMDESGSIFLSTVVGYNIRVKEYTGTPLKATYSQAKEVLIEFDLSAYADAISDGWSDTRDIPSVSAQVNKETVEIGGSSSSTKTYKVPFIFLKK